VFDPHASKLLGKPPLEIKDMQEGEKIFELEQITSAVEGNIFLVDLWKGEGGWFGKNFDLVSSVSSV